jgi:CheY-like chemotaxis protein
MKPIPIASIVDDDRIFVFGLSKLMEMISFSDELLVFLNGQEALDYFLPLVDTPEKLPDVILLDINMPVLDGWQFMDEFVRLKPNINKEITIYMVSSSVSELDIKKAKAYSEISDYVVKPMRSEDLLKMREKFNEEKVN